MERRISAGSMLQQPGRRSAHARWRLAALGLAVLVVFVLPNRQIKLGALELRGLVGSYLYEKWVNLNLSPQQVRLDDIYLPQTLRIAWAQSPPVGYIGPIFDVSRWLASDPNHPTDLGHTPNTYWVDSFPFTYGADYRYGVFIVQWQNDASLGLPAPPPGANAGDIHYIDYTTNGPQTIIDVWPQQSITSDNQTVDSRYDLRYSTYVFKNFQFGSKIYRGGLYTGFANDNSNVGRSFLKFQMSPLAVGTNLWTGGVDAYYTRSVINGNTVVGCQLVSNAWDGSTLVWSTAPAFDPTAASQTVTLAYNSSNPVSLWSHWAMQGDLANVLTGNGTASFALASTNETSANWAYFAKKEWNNGSNPPSVLYAYGAPLQAVRVTLSPSTVKGGSSVTGTVQLNGLAPAGGLLVSLSSDSPKAQPPASVMVTQGTSSANFTVTTSAVTQNTTANIGAAGVTQSPSAPLTITP